VISETAASPAAQSAIWPYVQIARVDHWLKNVFMLLGIVLALFYEPALFDVSSIWPLLVSAAATCLVASSNYVLNEILDAPSDRHHPEKQHRPIPAGRVRLPFAYAEWLLLGAVGLALAATLNRYMVASALALWVMGVVYNVPPLRTKEWPYVDVLSESINNPIRLLLGWFALVVTRVPPLSLVLSYWMVGAFFMAMKRYAEYRHIANPIRAASYRRSFAHYTEERLLVSIVFYATACALFGGIFIVRYHLELILFAPFAAGLFAYYMRIGLKPNSAVQNPESLHHERRFIAYLITCFAVFVALMFTSIPVLYDWFNVEASGTTPLWILGP
jgi:4-hydroxybenzoate polyprenyltransferase